MEIILLVLVALAVAETIASLDPKCRHYPKVREGHRVIHVVIPVECHSGFVEWRNHFGYIRLTAEKLAGYSLCLEQTFQSLLSNLQIMNSNTGLPIGGMLPDHMSCVPDHFGKAEMLITANPAMSNTAIFFYRIVNNDFS